MSKDDELKTINKREFQAWAKNRQFPNSTKNDFRTPPEIFAALNERFGPFTLDAAANEDNHLVDSYYDMEMNSLVQKWTGRVWVNPPYVKQKPEQVNKETGEVTPAIGRGDNTSIKEWAEKAWQSVESGDADRVVMLIPPHTETWYWYRTIFPNASHLVFVQGKLNFLGPYSRKGGASRNPTCAVVFSHAWKGSGMQVLTMSRKGEWLSEENYNRDVLKLKLKNGVEAYGKQLEGNQFVVLEGSTANLDPRPSWRFSDIRSRIRLIQNGSLKKENGKYRFTCDVTFNSPSRAASVVRACASNGKALWKLA